MCSKKQPLKFKAAPRAGSLKRPVKTVAEDGASAMITGPEISTGRTAALGSSRLVPFSRIWIFKSLMSMRSGFCVGFEIPAENVPVRSPTSAHATG